MCLENCLDDSPPPPVPTPKAASLSIYGEGLSLKKYTCHHCYSAFRSYEISNFSFPNFLFHLSECISSFPIVRKFPLTALLQMFFSK